jgi:hypothetical protein
MRVTALLLAASMLTATTAADAITYVGSRTIGTGSVNISVTTDGTIGAIGSGNIVDYTIDLFNLDGTFTLTSANSDVLVTGGLSATANDLLFNFDGSGLALFQAPGLGSGQTFYCLQGFTNCYVPTNVPGEAVEATTDFVYPSVTQSGLQVIASAGVVPEPATWAMMIGGFGLLGAAARRRVRTTVTYA